MQVAQLRAGGFASEDLLARPSRATLLTVLTLIACALTATGASPASAAAPTFGPESITGSVPGVPSKVVTANFNSDAYDDALVVADTGGAAPARSSSTSGHPPAWFQPAPWEM